MVLGGNGLLADLRRLGESLMRIPGVGERILSSLEEIQSSLEEILSSMKEILSLLRELLLLVRERGHREQLVRAMRLRESDEETASVGWESEDAEDN